MRVVCFVADVISVVHSSLWFAPSPQKTSRLFVFFNGGAWGIRLNYGEEETASSCVMTVAATKIVLLSTLVAVLGFLADTELPGHSWLSFQPLYILAKKSDVFRMLMDDPLWGKWNSLRMKPPVGLRSILHIIIPIRYCKIISTYQIRTSHAARLWISIQFFLDCTKHFQSTFF